jgi:7-cyano-7-deazaguanine synthase
MQKKAVCLLSGGLDSTVTTYYAVSHHYDVATLTFSYGQQHDRELKCARKINELLSIKDHVEIAIDFSHLTTTSLIKSTTQEITSHKLENIGSHIPSTYVPARNIIFLSLALSWAETLHCDAIFIGVNAIDYSGYPDCRPEFISAFEKTAALGTKQGVDDTPIKIVAPLIDMNKAEIIQLGIDLKVPFEHTWSCYRGQEQACGQCDSCQLRLKGFHDAGYLDPLSYIEYPKWYCP